MTDLKVVAGAAPLLFDMEEPLRDTRDLLRAAHMAASAIDDEYERTALKTVLDKAMDELTSVHGLWERALRSK
jgi:hypothetical protein